MRRSLALACAAVMCSACSPATLLRPSPPFREQPAVRLCGRADLGRGTAFSEGGGGEAIGVVELENVGPRTCAVQGVPRVILLSAEGSPLVVSQRSQQAHGRRVVLRPGDRAQADLSWRNYCGGPAAVSTTLVWREASLRLRPSENGWMRRARCDNPGERSTLDIGPFQRRGE
jgi:Domain of unknown function (DUF4232)